jgi:hypothetical protein
MDDTSLTLLTRETSFVPSLTYGPVALIDGTNFWHAKTSKSQNCPSHQTRAVYRFL